MMTNTSPRTIWRYIPKRHSVRSGREFHFQNNRKPLRCQRINVSGSTTVRAFRQSNMRESCVSVNRMPSVAPRGRTLRSTKNPSCLRRNRFSAATAARERKQVRPNAITSAETASMPSASIATARNGRLIERIPTFYEEPGHIAGKPDLLFADHTGSNREIRSAALCSSMPSDPSIRITTKTETISPDYR
jgi:hypothetical protein